MKIIRSTKILKMSNLHLMVGFNGIHSIFFFSDKCLADEHEARLMRFLMADYDAAVRPVENSSQPLTVVFGVSLHHIIDVVRKFNPTKTKKKLNCTILFLF